MKTVDAEGLILGRMATQVAKLALMGEQINIINCEKAVVSGSQSKIDKRHKLREMGSPFKGPFYPKTADRIVKRAIRGMLPYKQQRGRNAFERIRCYIGQPEGIECNDMISFPNASKEKIANIKTITVATISERI
jgi:large subunit ribosomal protein L13